MSSNRNTRRSQPQRTYHNAYPGDNYGSRSRQASRHTQKQKNTGTYLFLVMTFTVLSVVVMFIALSMTYIHANSKRGTALPDTPSQVSDSTLAPHDVIVGFDEDAEDAFSSEEISSETLNYADFGGKWQKTEVYETQTATLNINYQDHNGFDFTLKIRADSKTGSISGNAVFTGENTAVYTVGSASLTFERGSKYLSLYHTGSNTELGLPKEVTIDGKFTTGTPTYYQKEEVNHYDYTVYQSSAVTAALKATLSADDYNLYGDLMANGLMSPIAYERTVDKNGKQVNIDTELKCEKYYASLNSIGMNLILICSDSGKIYVLFYDAQEMRYYTNDSRYASKMPASFQAVANAKGITPTFK